jgi:hypothetical protein
VTADFSAPTLTKNVKANQSPFHGINNLNYCSFDSFDVDYLNFAVQ